MRWQTTVQPETGSFRQWADDLAQAFVRLEPTILNPGSPFTGQIVQTTVEDIQISRVSASGHKVNRLAEHIRAGERDVCFVNLQISGLGSTRQRGREISAAPMDLVVVDTTEEFEIAHRAHFDLFSLEVPRSKVPEQLLRDGGCSSARSPVHKELANALFSYASLSLLSAESQTMPAELIASHVIGLLGCFASVDERDGEPPHDADAKRAAMLGYLSRHLEDDDMGAEKIASAFGISARYVHKLFSVTGKSVSEHLCQLRIERAQSLLSQAAVSKLSITDIAFNLGFRDISYFNRRFKQITGMTPSDFRRSQMTSSAG
jgi:AraC family transcriptional regulator, positive regulator of tynA and feaB